MAYKWIGENWGQSLIKDAIAAGHTLEVSYERGYGEPDYKGADYEKAWEAVIAVDECHIFLEKEGAPSEWAFIVLDYGQEGDEVISDYSIPSGGGWIDAWWKGKSAAADAKA